MSRCPQCKREVPTGAETCPGCGRAAGALALGIGIGIGGDLVLEGLDAAHPAPRAKPAPLVSPAPGAAEASGEDAAWEMDPFDHDVSQVQMPSGPAAPSAGGALELDSSGGSLEIAAPRAAPLPLAPSPPDLSARAAEVAGFGPAPGGLVEAVRYALKVRARRAEMGAELARLSSVRRDAEKNATEMLASLAQAAKDAGISAEGEVASQAASAEARAEEEARAMASRTDEQKKQLSAIDREMQLATRDVPALQADEATLAKSYAEQSEKLRRIEARLKRAEIEIRSRRQIAAQKAAAGEGAESSRLEAEIRTYEADRDARAAEAKLERDRTEGIERELSAIRRRIAQALGKGSLVEDERRARESRFQHERLEQRKRVAAASLDATDRLAEVGRRILARHGGEEALSEAAGTARAAITARELLEREIEVLKVAMESHSAEGVKTGWMVMGGAAAVIVLGLVALGVFG